MISKKQFKEAIIISVVLSLLISLVSFFRSWAKYPFRGAGSGGVPGPWSYNYVDYGFPFHFKGSYSGEVSGEYFYWENILYNFLIVTAFFLIILLIAKFVGNFFRNDSKSGIINNK